MSPARLFRAPPRSEGQRRARFSSRCGPRGGGGLAPQGHPATAKAECQRAVWSWAAPGPFLFNTLKRGRAGESGRSV